MRLIQANTSRILKQYITYNKTFFLNYGFPCLCIHLCCERKYWKLESLKNSYCRFIGDSYLKDFGCDDKTVKSKVNTARMRSLPWARWVQSTKPIIFNTTLPCRFSSPWFLHIFEIKFLVNILHISRVSQATPISFTSCFLWVL